MMRTFKACLLLFVLTTAAAAAQLPKGVLAVDGRPAPELRLADMDGEELDLASLRGRWVFVHFWASWCGPCREEMPTIQRLTAGMDSDSLAMVLVNTAETEDEIFTFLSAVAPDLHTLMDADGRVTAVWQPRGLPATFLVDPRGRIRYQVLGGRPWDTPPYRDFLLGLREPETPQTGSPGETK